MSSLNEVDSAAYFFEMFSLRLCEFRIDWVRLAKLWDKFEVNDRADLLEYIKVPSPLTKVAWASDRIVLVDDKIPSNGHLPTFKVGHVESYMHDIGEFIVVIGDMAFQDVFSVGTDAGRNLRLFNGILTDLRYFFTIRRKTMEDYADSLGQVIPLVWQSLFTILNDYGPAWVESRISELICVPFIRSEIFRLLLKIRHWLTRVQIISFIVPWRLSNFGVFPELDFPPFL
jgi:hypothetical protein